MSDSFRKESRREWSAVGAVVPANDQLALGCLQRIADATELMAKRYQDLVDERDRFKRYYEQEQATARRLVHRTNGLRGRITRLSNDLAKAREVKP